MNPDFFDFDTLREDFDLEVKEAAGKDQRGALPKSLWETYSAMANSDGGYIILGGVQKNKSFQWQGISEPEKVIKQLWDTLNNAQKISVNLLNNRDVSIVSHEGINLIIVQVPRASRKQKPVYIGTNPLTGTYRRNYEGDYKCSEEIVKQMLGEQTNDSRDGTLQENTGILDIELPTLKAYRQNFSSRKPDHPFNDHEDLQFLRQIGGFTVDRNLNKGGLTLAGLLMFGKLRSILDYIPKYIVDYQERPRAVTELRWVDRITTDFTWAGNLYSFYRIVYQKLISDIKVPFVLKEGQRIDDTPVHEALREALVNTLIHADYFGDCSILVVKRPDLIGFRNPGLLRIPREEALRGGVSDCRNRNLQKMFQLIGFGEQAGSGFPKIYQNWKAQHWRTPELEERISSNQTILALRMSSLLPESIVLSLKKHLGDQFNILNSLELLTLVTAKAEGCVTHRRLAELSTEHPTDLTRTLHKLYEAGLLQSEGTGKATFYFIPGEHPMRGDIFHSINHNAPNSEHNAPNSEHNAPNSEHNAPNSEHNAPNSEHNAPNSEHSLESIARIVSLQKRVQPEVMKQTIINLCLQQELSIAELASLLNRGEDTIRTHYVNPMCKKGLLKRKYSNIINHPQQKYYAFER